LPCFFFHVNGDRDAIGFEMSGLVAARRHAEIFEAASRWTLGGGAAWRLIVTDERGRAVIELPRRTVVPSYDANCSQADARTEAKGSSGNLAAGEAWSAPMTSVRQTS
jgi:hypothetical protein